MENKLDKLTYTDYNYLIDDYKEYTIYNDKLYYLNYELYKYRYNIDLFFDMYTRFVK